MKTHRRSWMLRAGVVALLATGALVGATAPAFANIVRVTADPLGDFRPGDTKQLKVHATGNGQNQRIDITGLTGDFDISLTGPPRGGCTNQSSTSCTFDFTGTGQIGGQEDITFTIAAHQNVNLPPGQVVNIHVGINGTGSSGGIDFRLFGPAAAQTTAPAVQTVTEVTGTVKDGTNGNPINKANVTLQDSAGHNYSMTTGTSGVFSFKGSAAMPIAPGVAAVGVEAPGYAPFVKNSPNLAVGQTYRFTAAFGMTPAAATPSAAPSSADTAAASAPSDGGSASSQSNLNPTAKNAGSGSFSTILIALGGLLILLGVGAVVYILVRRRKDTDEDDVDAGGPGRGPVPAGAARAGYANDATTVAPSGGYGQPTMATTRDPLADAPTMLQGRPPVDDYPDPYAAPPPPPAPRPGYGGDATQQYGGATQQYGGGATQQYGGAAPYGGSRYDEPTGYADRDGYRSGGASGNVYGEPEPTRYADRGGYQEPTRGGYDEPARGGYEEPARGGYEEPARGGGYSGYDPPAGGYEPRRSSPGEHTEPSDPYEGGYDGGRARHGTPASDSRRQLDWLDD